MSQAEKKLPEGWAAFGPEKEAWKKAGNYYTAEELAEMAREWADLTMERRPRPVYVVD